MTDYGQKRAGFGPLFFLPARDEFTHSCSTIVGKFTPTKFVRRRNRQMTLEVDHAFVACAPGAPEAAALLQLGLQEGSSNTHPGQGTANRRFFFENFMLELVWVTDRTEATSAQTRRTRLWERCSKQETGVNPFGIVFRAVGDHEPAAPFATWNYHPSYLPAGTAIQIAEGTTLQEPELFYLPFLRQSGVRRAEPTSHAQPLGKMRQLRAGVPRLKELSDASRSAENCGLLSYFESEQPLLEMQFSSSSDLRLDLRPALPLVLRGAA
jgi:hypothetical protein